MVTLLTLTQALKVRALYSQPAKDTTSNNKSFFLHYKCLVKFVKAV